MERKRIYLVGLGPGGREQMTQQAYAALADADAAAGRWKPRERANLWLCCAAGMLVYMAWLALCSS